MPIHVTVAGEDSSLAKAKKKKEAAEAAPAEKSPSPADETTRTAEKKAVPKVIGITHNTTVEFSNVVPVLTLDPVSAIDKNSVATLTGTIAEERNSGRHRRALAPSARRSDQRARRT